MPPPPFAPPPYYGGWPFGQYPPPTWPTGPSGPEPSIQGGRAEMQRFWRWFERKNPGESFTATRARLEEEPYDLEGLRKDVTPEERKAVGLPAGLLGQIRRAIASFQQ